MEDDAPLLDLLERVQPNTDCTSRWIAVLEAHLERLRALEGITRRTPVATAQRGTVIGKSILSGDYEAAQKDGRVEARGSSSSSCAPAAARQSPASTRELARGPPTLPTGFSCQSLVSPQANRLPARVVWAITLLTSLFVAVANNLIVWTVGLLMGWKFEAVQDVMTDGGLGAGTFTLAGICVGFGAAAAALVAIVAPVCAGSGLPEAKGYLNGNYIRGIFKVRVLLVRIFGIILALTAGFPIGREGPMVGIGGTLGYGIVHFLALPWARRWVQVSSSKNMKSALIVDEERFAHAKRVGFILGGAAGIATAFDAPIGGILYMFEEATMTTWPPELTFRAFVCTLCGALISRALFNLAGQDVHRLLIYVEEREDRGSWDWPDVPFFVVLAACLGIFSAVFARVLVAVWRFRQARMRAWHSWQPYARIAECMLYAVLCALTFALVPVAVGCVTEARDSQGKAGHPVPSGLPAESLQFVRHSCKEGDMNEVATLLFKGAEGTVKHLFSRNTDTSHPSSLAVALAVYATLAAGMAGLPVPMGNFLPSMLIGALAGRLLGEAVGSSAVGHTLADAGVYALVGSAAMLSGFTHMTIAVVVILVEAAHDLSLALPSDAVLPPEASVGAVQRALEKWEVTSFPVVVDGVCVGLTPRTRLEAAMRARGAYLSKDLAPVKVLDDNDGAVQSPCHLSEEDDELDLGELLEGLYSPMASSLKLEVEGPPFGPEATLPLHSIMDPSPYTILEDMPAPRLYPLFTRTGTSVACVVSTRGEFRGLLSRVNLISAAKRALRPAALRKRRYERL